MSVISKLLLHSFVIIGLLFTCGFVYFAKVNAVGCQIYECGYNDPETGVYVPMWCDGCGGNVDYCSPAHYRAPDGSCHAVGGGGCECGTTASGGCRSCGGTGVQCPGPINCVHVDPQRYTDYNRGGFNFPASCDLGNAASQFRTCDNVGLDDNDQPIYDCYWTYRVHSCCPEGSTVQCSIVNRNTTYQAGSPEDAYDVFVRTTQVVTSQRWGQTGWYCVYEEDGVCLESAGIYDWIYTYGTTNVYRDFDQVCSCQATCTSTAPTSLTVAQGASATSATMSWRSGTGGTSQTIYVGTNQNSVDNNCSSGGCIISGATVSPFVASTNYSYPVTGLTPNTIYYFRVVTHQNTSCRPGTTVSYTAPANNTVTGRVFMDANNNCSTSTPWNSATYGSLTATLRGTAYSGNVGTDGRFSISAGTAPSFSYLDLSGIPTGYICSTASGCNNCPTISSITSPSSADYPFYLTPRREAWWRVIGGSIYAEGNVRSELPRSTSELIIAGAGGALGSLMQSTGTLDVGAGALSSAGYMATTEYKGKLMNYDYFAAHMGVTPNTVNDWAADTMNKPANNPSKAFYYINPSGSEASVSTPWTVAAGESYVIFVNGDLRIASDITVANGGFLAFIVNGSVRVSPAVANVGGLYVIDSTLITESNGGTDVSVTFQGSVVAWGGVNLGRDLVGSNANSAAEMFTYRPDLLTNMPDAMKVFALKWEEVVPGTIGQ